MHLINIKELSIISGWEISWEAVMSIKRNCAVVREAVKSNTPRFIT